MDTQHAHQIADMVTRKEFDDTITALHEYVLKLRKQVEQYEETLSKLVQLRNASVECPQGGAR